MENQTEIKDQKESQNDSQEGQRKKITATQLIVMTIVSFLLPCFFLAWEASGKQGEPFLRLDAGGDIRFSKEVKFYIDEFEGVNILRFSLGNQQVVLTNKSVGSSKSIAEHQSLDEYRWASLSSPDSRSWYTGQYNILDSLQRELRRQYNQNKINAPIQLKVFEDSLELVTEKLTSLRTDFDNQITIEKRKQLASIDALIRNGEQDDDHLMSESIRLQVELENLGPFIDEKVEQQHPDVLEQYNALKSKVAKWEGKTRLEVEDFYSDLELDSYSSTSSWLKREWIWLHTRKNRS